MALENLTALHALAEPPGSPGPRQARPNLFGSD